MGGTASGGHIDIDLGTQYIPIAAIAGCDGSRIVGRTFYGGHEAQPQSGTCNGPVGRSLTADFHITTSGRKATLFCEEGPVQVHCAHIEEATIATEGLGFDLVGRF